MTDDLDFIPGEDDTADDLRTRFVLLDVRETVELAAAPLAGAHHLPTSDFDVSRLDVPQDVDLLVVCARGVRSRRAVEYLRAQGWGRAVSLAGGLPAFPVAGSSSA